MAAKKLLLKDKDGALYLLPGIVALHPVEIRQNERNRMEVTAVHTNITTVGGQTHNTSIPFAEASAAFEDLHEPFVPVVAPPAAAAKGGEEKTTP